MHQLPRTAQIVHLPDARLFPYRVVRSDGIRHRTTMHCTLDRAANAAKRWTQQRNKNKQMHQGADVYGGSSTQAS